MTAMTVISSSTEERPRTLLYTYFLRGNEKGEEEAK